MRYCIINYRIKRKQNEFRREVDLNLKHREKLSNSSRRDVNQIENEATNKKRTHLFMSLYCAARNCLAASVSGCTASAIKTVEGRSK